MCTTKQTLLIYTIILWILVIPITGTVYVGFRILDCMSKASSDLSQVVFCFTNNYSYILIILPLVFYIHVIFLTLLYCSRKEYKEHDLERNLRQL